MANRYDNVVPNKPVASNPGKPAPGATGREGEGDIGSKSPSSKGLPKQSDFASTGEWAAAMRKYREGQKSMESEAVKKAMGK